MLFCQARMRHSPNPWKMGRKWFLQNEPIRHNTFRLIRQPKNTKARRRRGAKADGILLKRGNNVKLTILADNNTLIDQYYLGEPAVSYLIEEAGERFLLDMGYSDVFLRNAALAGAELSGLSAVVFSHGHNDHTGGMRWALARPEFAGVRLLAHPDLFAPRTYEGLQVGSVVTQSEAAARWRLTLTDQPVQLTRRLWYLGAIPRRTGWESKTPIGLRETAAGPVADFLPDDTALAYRGERGVVLITGCSHSGVCNLIERAKEVCGCDRLDAVVGGLHLMQDNGAAKQTVEYLNRQAPRLLYPCHCTCFAVKARMARTLPVQEVGSGTVLEF